MFSFQNGAQHTDHSRYNAGINFSGVALKNNVNSEDIFPSGPTSSLILTSRNLDSIKLTRKRPQNSLSDCL